MNKLSNASAGQAYPEDPRSNAMVCSCKGVIEYNAKHMDLMQTWYVCGRCPVSQSDGRSVERQQR